MQSPKLLSVNGLIIVSVDEQNSTKGTIVDTGEHYQATDDDGKYVWLVVEGVRLSIGQVVYFTCGIEFVVGVTKHVALMPEEVLCIDQQSVSEVASGKWPERTGVH